MMVAIPASNVPTARAGTRRGAIGVASDATTEQVLAPGERARVEPAPVETAPVEPAPVEQAQGARRPDRKTHRRTGSPAPSDTFSAFYGSEYHAVVALAYALTGRAAVAEELAQDAFLVTHRNWERISAYDVPGAFVRRVVANMAVSFARRLAAEARALARLAARSPKWSAPLEPPDANFWRSVRSLPRRQAQVLALRYLEDLPDDEIAGILGCSSATVRVHLHNGRLALAGRLGIATNGRSSA
jgi:RNA polymerase sigma-70 factor, ECF subfamily